MKTQIRIYTIVKGELSSFVEEWRNKIKPLRIKIGFRILKSWIDQKNNKFIWILTLENDADWERLDNNYHNSKERKSMTPNPARNIVNMKSYFINEV
jgi:hypothetical protein